MIYDLKRSLFFFLSLIIVSFGQPAFISYFGIFSSLFGFSLFFNLLLSLNTKKEKFKIGFFWFFLVQLVQLSWFISHPYSYIYLVYIIIAAIMAFQFGLTSLLITQERILSISAIFGIASFWTIMEWIRLFILSGFPFNPIGLSMTVNLYSMQLATLLGVYGLTFFTMLTNLLLLRALHKRQFFPWLTWTVFALFPYFFGVIHYHYHHSSLKDETKNIEAILVQTAFPIEENLGIKTPHEFISYVMEEWNKILFLLKKQVGKKVDIIVLPEFVVPLGTYTFIYPIEKVNTAFQEIFGKDVLKLLPKNEYLFTKAVHTHQGIQYLVNNAYWAKGIANIFNAPILLGLEDVDEEASGEKNYYSSAIYIQPKDNFIGRYEKRVLVPMGEYIPFSWCRKMAANYGISGSFTCGKEAKIFHTSKFPFGVSICYEETYGNVMRECSFNGAEVLFNLTSDVWYPKLAKQHFDHSRLRTVESGIPLIRACNTGITCAVDSLGNIVNELDEYNDAGQWLADSLHVKVPAYHYATLYSKFGDSLIIGFSFFCLPMLFNSFYANAKNKLRRFLKL